MNKFTAAALVSLMAPTMAFAGPVEVPPAPVPVVIDPVVTWDGFYVGLGAATTMGDIDFFNPDVPRELDDGNLHSIFAGYRMQNGNLVYGGELALHMVDEIAVTGFAGTSALDGTFVDARATLGYALGSVLVYGALGFSTGTYDDILATDGNEFDLTGFNYGLGAEFQITDSIIVGLDYTARMLEGDNPNSATQTTEVDLNTISLRASFRF
ncbi:outer membrane protein [Gymnodinialimonas sp.]